MGDFGIKISEEGNNVNTSDLDGTVFNSAYPSLMFIEKQTIEFTAEEGETHPTGTEIYTHSYGYCPLVLGFVQGYGGGIYFSIPYTYTRTPFPGTYVETSINMKVKINTVEVIWSVNEYLPGTDYPLSGDLSYKVDLYIYGYELGSTT